MKRWQRWNPSAQQCWTEQRRAGKMLRAKDIEHGTHRRLTPINFPTWTPTTRKNQNLSRSKIGLARMAFIFRNNRIAIRRRNQTQGEQKSIKDRNQDKRDMGQGKDDCRLLQKQAFLNNKTAPDQFAKTSKMASRFAFIQLCFKE